MDYFCKICAEGTNFCGCYMYYWVRNIVHQLKTLV